MMVMGARVLGDGGVRWVVVMGVDGCLARCDGCGRWDGWCVRAMRWVTVRWCPGDDGMTMGDDDGDDDDGR